MTWTIKLCINDFCRFSVYALYVFLKGLLHFFAR